MRNDTTRVHAAGRRQWAAAGGSGRQWVAACCVPNVGAEAGKCCMCVRHASPTPTSELMPLPPIACCFICHHSRDHSPARINDVEKGYYADGEDAYDMRFNFPKGEKKATEEKEEKEEKGQEQKEEKGNKSKAVAVADVTSSVKSEAVPETNEAVRGPPAANI